MFFSDCTMHKKCTAHKRDMEIWPKEYSQCWVMNNLKSCEDSGIHILAGKGKQTLSSGWTRVIAWIYAVSSADGIIVSSVITERKASWYGILNCKSGTNHKHLFDLSPMTFIQTDFHTGSCGCLFFSFQGHTSTRMFFFFSFLGLITLTQWYQLISPRQQSVSPANDRAYQMF